MGARTADEEPDVLEAGVALDVADAVLQHTTPVIFSRRHGGSMVVLNNFNAFDSRGPSAARRSAGAQRMRNIYFECHDRLGRVQSVAIHSCGIDGWQFLYHSDLPHE